eukprot:scaffold451_cov121-Cylindrotheca_fusiformis.AAC.4
MNGQFSLLILFCGLMLWREQFHIARSTVADVSTSPSDVKVVGWVRPDMLYGHFHLAKTAGTTLNGLMASRFERICGHKGYSYDYYQYNERIRQGAGPWAWKSGRASGRVMPPVMDDIGYEDCDWISLEDKMSAWRRFSGENKTNIEMHVPCRDPLEHFMSQCNYRKHRFNCSITEPMELAKEIHKCLKDEDRFRAKEIPSFGPNMNFKCFNPIPVTRYVDYMGQLLQERRFVVDHIERETNRKRHKERECLWNMTDVAKHHLIGELKVQWDLYDFCDKCMGSNNELLLPA